MHRVHVVSKYGVLLSQTSKKRYMQSHVNQSIHLWHGCGFVQPQGIHRDCRKILYPAICEKNKTKKFSRSPELLFLEITVYSRIIGRKITGECSWHREWKIKMQQNTFILSLTLLDVWSIFPWTFCKLVSLHQSHSASDWLSLLLQRNEVISLQCCTFFVALGGAVQFWTMEAHSKGVQLFACKIWGGNAAKNLYIC